MLGFRAVVTIRGLWNGNSELGILYSRSNLLVKLFDDIMNDGIDKEMNEPLQSATFQLKSSVSMRIEQIMPDEELDE
jgi:hypothetical protein